jgi:hypothetical protein
MSHAVGYIAAWFAVSMSQIAMHADSEVSAQEPVPAARSTLDPKKETVEAQQKDQLTQWREMGWERWKETEFPALLKTIEDSIPEFEKDTFDERQAAQAKIQGPLRNLVHFINPIPPDVDAAIRKVLLPIKDRHTPEQRARMRNATEFIDSESERNPTRVPIPPDASAEQISGILKSHARVLVDLSAIPDAEKKLKALGIDPAKNTYANLLEQVCSALNAYPATPQNASDTIQLLEHTELSRKIFTDPSGIFLCVLEQHENGEPPVLRIFCDPKISVATLKKAETTNTGGQQYRVITEPTKLQPTVNHDDKIKLGKPVHEQLSTDYCPPSEEESQITERGIILRGPILTDPKEFTLPLDGVGMQNLGPQLASASYNEEKGAVVVRVRASNPIDTPTTFWIEAAVNANTFTLTGPDGEVLYSGRAELLYSPKDGHVFDLQLPPTKKPAGIRMQGYGYSTDWNKVSQNGDAVFVEFPKEIK